MKKLVSKNPKDVTAIAESKVPLQLIPPEAEIQIAKAMSAGAEVYGPWNWRDSPIGLMTYIGAMKRHLNAIARGEDKDPKSGLPHLAHVAATAAILIDATAHNQVLDDRPGS